MSLTPHHDLLLQRFAAGPVRIDRRLPEIDDLERAGFVVRLIGVAEGEFIHISEAGSERLKRQKAKFAKRLGTFLG